ncbi:transcriptional regulator with XRE-family HTH domain [Saccharopolyspora lacisalsi]|uniref:Transcriptional regulator with XRE-family HTH domain n=1 Tax=Halosaccharopolyspora lacisalsi TaxID=1000566 RepID=A0A839E189_9PSEU|nr:helix-turn-helix transcriptional regulator [Halosaccharopolyspora lacisalsi]MBA8827564.1 transcriptional regulator with XRE-family HTH domain [Halosaccharopolyspora lacisalsi]
MAPSSPTVAAWALGRRLREKRDQAGLTATAAAKRFGITSAYLSEFEHGKKNVGEDRLEALLDAYEFDKDEADELRVLRKEAGRRGWWSDYTGLFSDELLRFFGYEHGAESIRTYGSDIVTGLLQTEEYARALIEAGSPNLRLAEVDRRIQARLHRQNRLTGEDPLQLSTIMSEAVLYQQVGGREVLAGQLKYLGDLVEQQPGNLDIRIVPFEATGHEAMGGSIFHLMTFPSGKLPTLLWQETVTSTQVITDPMTVREYHLAYTEVTKAALDRKSSLLRIKDAYGRLRSRTTVET